MMKTLIGTKGFELDQPKTKEFINSVKPKIDEFPDLKKEFEELIKNNS